MATSVNFTVIFDTGEAMAMTAAFDSDIASLKKTIAHQKNLQSIDNITISYDGAILTDEMKMSDIKFNEESPHLYCQLRQVSEINEINQMLDTPLIDLPKEEQQTLSIPNVTIVPNLDETNPQVTLDDQTQKSVLDVAMLDPKAITLPWTDEENEILRKKVEEMGTKWKKIQPFLPERTSNEIAIHYKKELNPTKEAKQSAWTDQEEQMLVEKVNEFGRKWSQIAPFFNRTPRAIEGHWEKIMNQGKNMSTKPWTEEEEARLVEKVTEFGTKWTHISQFFERTPKALERHWAKKMNKENKPATHESPHPWSQDEEQKLREKVNELGTNWPAISQFFNRTPGGIKLQWYRMKRRDDMSME